MPESALNVYEQVYTDSPLGETLHPGGLALTNQALMLAGLPVNAKIVDIGCGTGTTLYYLQSLGYNAAGVDISSVLLCSSLSQGSRLDIMQADAPRLPLASTSMDAILVECSLSEFTPLSEVLTEFNRVLTPPGRMIITDLYARNPSGLPEVRKKFPSSCLSRAFIQSDLFEALSQTGFTVTTWQDRSDVVKSLSSGRMLTTFSGPAATEYDPMDILLVLVGARLGYFICIAGKNGQTF